MQIDKEKILEAKAKIGDKTPDMIAALLNLEHYNSSRHVACCPAHDDSTPSFSYNPKTYSFYCFGCGYTVDLIDAYMKTGSTFLEAVERLFRAADINYSFAERGVRTSRSYRYPRPVYADTKDSVYAYWSKRGISKETIDYLDIAEDKNGNTLFQYKDDNDVLVGCKVRPSRKIDKTKDKRKCWWLTDKDGKAYDMKMILFNRNKVNTTQPLIITSGEGDCASCVEAGFTNATSIPSGDTALQWLTEEWDFLANFDTIILVHDNDDSGRKFAKEVSRRLGEYRVKIAEIPETVTYKDKTVFVKDMNQYLIYCGKDAVREVIIGAKEQEIPSIIDYTQVTQFDMSDVDGIKSGFEMLDKAIDKFYVGTTNVITGITGSGKSSLLSTLICQSVEQGYPAFVYSGELSNQSLKNWVDSVFAGQYWLTEFQQQGYCYYKIKPEAYDRINSFYRGELYFYKDSFDHKTSSLLSAMEFAVRRLGVKTIVLDNLSSINLENDDNNKWSKMDEFVRDVIEFSKKWQVIIFLVLHPKKMDMVRRMSVFDLQGVVSSANLSHRILSLYRVSDKEKEGVKGFKAGTWKIEPLDCDVVLDVLKDRYGSGQGKAIKLWYDKPSRRFFDTLETLSYRYKWDKGKKNERLPFFDYEEWYKEDEVFGGTEDYA